MLRLFRAWMPGVLVLCATATLLAQGTADRYALPAAPVNADALSREDAAQALPAWNDGASVYLTAHAQAAEPAVSAEVLPNAYDDPRVAQAAYQQVDQQSVNAEPDQRRLAPPTDEQRPDAQQPTTAASGLASSWGLPLDSLVTTITALVLVVGLFLLFVWALRRGSRHAAGMLPKDVVSVLGSASLGGRQMAQLLRVGNKLVLISVTPSGAKPLAEVTDPTEVDRLLGLCLHGDLRSTTSSYEKTFRQLAPEPTLKGLPGIGTPLAKTPSASDFFRAYQGGTERA